MPVPATKQAGFTLVELLVAMTIMGLMMTVLFGSLHLSARAWDSGEKRMEEAGDITRVQGFLRGRISLARPIPVPDHLDRVHRDHVLFEGGGDSLYFIAPMPAHRGGGGLQLAEITLAQEGLVFSHRLYHAEIESVTEGNWRTSLLLPDVDAVRFRYFGRREGEERRGWRNSWRNQSHLPHLVEIEIERGEGARERWPTLVVETGITERSGRTPDEEGFGP